MSYDPIDMYGPDPADGDRSYEWDLEQIVRQDPARAVDTLRRQDEELTELRARVVELEQIEQRAREVRDEDPAYDGGPEAAYILGES